MPKQPIPLTVPKGTVFADLKLSRDADGDVSFDWAPIKRICEASGIDIDALQTEDHIGSLLTAWYRAARRDGEPADPIMEDLLIEIVAEDERGGGLSHKPGTA